MNNLISTFASTGPDFSGLTETISSWITPIFNIIIVIVAIIATIRLIVIGIEVLREKDPNQRQENIKHIGYWFFGLIIAGFAAVAVNIIIPIVFTNVG